MEDVSIKPSKRSEKKYKLKDKCQRLVVKINQNRNAKGKEKLKLNINMLIYL